MSESLISRWATVCLATSLLAHCAAHPLFHLQPVSDEDALLLLLGALIGGADSRRCPDRGPFYGTKIVDSQDQTGRVTSLDLIDCFRIGISYEHTTDSALRFAYSDDGGSTFALSTLDNTATVAQSTELAMQDDNVYIAYRDTTNSALKIARSTDRGQSFSLSSLDSPAGLAPAMTVDGNNVFIASSSDELRLARSFDSGQSFLHTTIDPNGREPSLLLTGNTIHLAFYDFVDSSLRFGVSTDGGDSFSFQTVDNDADVGREPCLAVQGSNIHIGYHDFTNRNLKYALSQDGCASFSVQTLDSSGFTGTSCSIQLEGNNVYIAYHAFSASNARMAVSYDGGLNFQIIEIETPDNDGYFTSLAVSEGTAYISHWDETGKDLRFSKSQTGILAFD
ncbi:MAG: hypothetical protein CMN76_03995 [Spirochaetaceae bacterium]|nr:hypothetical protein [Spirochaetaceae bacterium]|tara:strand:+ start:261814 stop:262992 length:1179 start_codon:yes stop_codon:yes gene_type:complete